MDFLGSGIEGRGPFLHLSVAGGRLGAKEERFGQGGLPRSVGRDERDVTNVGGLEVLHWIASSGWLTAVRSSIYLAYENNTSLRRPQAVGATGRPSPRQPSDSSPAWRRRFLLSRTSKRARPHLTGMAISTRPSVHKVPLDLIFSGPFPRASVPWSDVPLV